MSIQPTQSYQYRSLPDLERDRLEIESLRRDAQALKEFVHDIWVLEHDEDADKLDLPLEQEQNLDNSVQKSEKRDQKEESDKDYNCTCTIHCTIL